jgi:hypothetical protein
LQHRLSTTEDENKRPKSFRIGLRQFYVAPKKKLPRARARDRSQQFLPSLPSAAASRSRVAKRSPATITSEARRYISMDQFIRSALTARPSIRLRRRARRRMRRPHPRLLRTRRQSLRPAPRPPRSAVPRPLRSATRGSLRRRLSTAPPPPPARSTAPRPQRPRPRPTRFRRRPRRLRRSRSLCHLHRRLRSTAGRLAGAALRRLRIPLTSSICLLRGRTSSRGSAAARTA